MVHRDYRHSRKWLAGSTLPAERPRHHRPQRPADDWHSSHAHYSSREQGSPAVRILPRKSRLIPAAGKRSFQTYCKESNNDGLGVIPRWNHPDSVQLASIQHCRRHQEEVHVCRGLHRNVSVPGFPLLAKGRASHRSNRLNSTSQVRRQCHRPASLLDRGGTSLPQGSHRRPLHVRDRGRRLSVSTPMHRRPQLQRLLTW